MYTTSCRLISSNPPCSSFSVVAIAVATNGSLVARLGDTDTMAPAEPTFIDSLSLVDMVTCTSRVMMEIMMAVGEVGQIAVPDIVLVAMMVLGGDGTWRVCAAAGHLCWLGIPLCCTAVWPVILWYLNRILCMPFELIPPLVSSMRLRLLCGRKGVNVHGVCMITRTQHPLRDQWRDK